MIFNMVGTSGNLEYIYRYYASPSSSNASFSIPITLSEYSQILITSAKSDEVNKSMVYIKSATPQTFTVGYENNSYTRTVTFASDSITFSASNGYAHMPGLFDIIGLKK